MPSGTPTEAAADRVATIALAPGANTTIPIEHWFSAGVVLSATTANDATGDPGPDDLELTIAWANGG